MLTIGKRLAEIGALVSGNQRYLGFLAPATAACLAAARCRGINIQVSFEGSARSYAATIGLRDILAGSSSLNRPVIGRSYSPLVELATHHQVEQCNTVINDLIATQLAGYERLTGEACAVVGELHNNVPAHAHGTGFSMAQYYHGEGILEVAVADGGRGMFYNVSQADPGITTHEDAVNWCIGRGNTTAGEEDDWAQRLPDDVQGNPFGYAVPTTGDDQNHHMGLGLWKLEQVARITGGEFAIWSGDAQLRLENGNSRVEKNGYNWNGVVVILRLPIAGNDALGNQGRSESLEILASRFRL